MYKNSLVYNIVLIHYTTVQYSKYAHLTGKSAVLVKYFLAKLSVNTENGTNKLRTNLLLLLLLNHLPPDITSGQGLNGFQKIIFTILRNFLGGDWYHIL